MKRGVLAVLLLVVLSAGLLGGGLLTFAQPECGFIYTANSSTEVIFEVVRLDDETCSPYYGIPPFTFEWNFGDQSVGFNVITSEPSITHTYAEPGAYLVTLSMPNRPSTVFVRTINLISEAPPLSADLSVGATYLTITYSVVATGGTGGNYLYSVDFADGSEPSTSPQGAHTFDVAGVYNMLATVHDEAGQEVTDSETIVVKAKPPPGELQPPLRVGFEWSSVNLVVNFVGSAYGGEGGYVFQWKFGDGEQIGGVRSVEHTYAASGFYVVTMTVTDAQGNTKEVTQSITVKTGIVDDGKVGETPSVPFNLSLLLAIVGAGFAGVLVVVGAFKRRRILLLLGVAIAVVVALARLAGV